MCKRVWRMILGRQVYSKSDPADANPSSELLNTAALEGGREGGAKQGWGDWAKGGGEGGREMTAWARNARVDAACTVGDVSNFGTAAVGGAVAAGAVE